MNIIKLKNNLSKNMLWYTLIAIITGFIFGYHFDMSWMSSLMIPVVFIMIYPMMVGIAFEDLKKIKKTLKPLIVAILLNFAYAPALFYIFSLNLDDERLKIALIILAIAPTSSMGLGYLGVAEGDMLSGVIIVTVSFLLSLIVYPITGVIITKDTEFSISAWLLIKNLLFILVFPLLLGILTHEYIVRKHGKKAFNKVKPYFGVVTLIFVYFLVFMVFATKAKKIAKNPIEILYIGPIVLGYYFITIPLIIYLNKKILKMNYKKIQSVIFTTVSKNVALTIAVLIQVFGDAGQFMAIVPAITAMFQAPILMFYLKNSKKVKKYFGEIDPETYQDIEDNMGKIMKEERL